MKKNAKNYGFIFFYLIGSSSFAAEVNFSGSNINTPATIKLTETDKTPYNAQPIGYSSGFSFNKGLTLLGLDSEPENTIVIFKANNGGGHNSVRGGLFVANNGVVQLDYYTSLTVEDGYKGNAHFKIHASDKHSQGLMFYGNHEYHLNSGSVIDISSTGNFIIGSGAQLYLHPGANIIINNRKNYITFNTKSKAEIRGQITSTNMNEESKINVQDATIDILSDQSTQEAMTNQETGIIVWHLSSGGIINLVDRSIYNGHFHVNPGGALNISGTENLIHQLSLSNGLVNLNSGKLTVQTNLFATDSYLNSIVFGPMSRPSQPSGISFTGA